VILLLNPLLHRIIISWCHYFYHLSSLMYMYLYIFYVAPLLYSYSHPFTWSNNQCMTMSCSLYQWLLLDVIVYFFSSLCCHSSYMYSMSTSILFTLFSCATVYSLSYYTMLLLSLPCSSHQLYACDALIMDLDIIISHNVSSYKPYPLSVVLYSLFLIKVIS
jgi:hypothetical protein